jgi:hypothetical protein
MGESKEAIDHRQYFEVAYCSLEEQRNLIYRKKKKKKKKKKRIKITNLESAN